MSKLTAALMAMGSAVAVVSVLAFLWFGNDLEFGFGGPQNWLTACVLFASLPGLLFVQLAAGPEAPASAALIAVFGANLAFYFMLALVLLTLFGKKNAENGKHG